MRSHVPPVVSPAEAVAGIRSGQQVYLQGAAATPSVLLDALVARAQELEDVRMVHLHTEGPGPHLAPAMARHFRHLALFIGPNARQAINEGRAEYIPTFLSDVPRLFLEGHLPLDAALINVSPPDEHGFCSLGTSVDATPAAVRGARTVIAQFNRGVPRTLGDSFIHASDIDLAVDCDQPPYEVPLAAVGDVERRIGEFVADLVPDGATIQMGIGAIPVAVGRALADKRDLGVHTEMFTDVVVDLVERGAITGARKEINRGRIVSAFLMGTRRLYDFVDDNPMVELRPVDYTNDTAVIRRLSRMTAINSAIEVDLTGQVVADSIGSRLYSGVGGQMDFIRGAALAPEGRAIIALPSTATGGTSSRIVPFLREGAGVVTTRAHVRTVVTEWGVAELFGRSIRERAQALIAIADPRFRDELSDQARRTHWL
jgi:acyl-CoA hydrolase